MKVKMCKRCSRVVELDELVCPECSGTDFKYVELDSDYEPAVA